MYGYGLKISTNYRLELKRRQVPCLQTSISPILSNVMSEHSSPASHLSLPLIYLSIKHHRAAKSVNQIMQCAATHVYRGANYSEQTFEMVP